MKLDSKDKLILIELQNNARQSMTKIAKKTKLPIDVVKYRIKKYENEGIIKKYVAYLDNSKLGKPLFAYFVFTLYNLNIEEEKKFISYLINHKKIIYVSKNSGKWDFTAGICATDYIELDAVVREIRSAFQDKIKDYDVTLTIEEYKLFDMSGLI